MLKISYEKGGREIQIEGVPHPLPCKIISAFPFEDRVVVLLNTYELADSDPRMPRNVFALDRDGKELWRIEETRHRYEAKDGKEYSLPWSMIIKKTDGSGYWIFSMADYRFDFDPMTGKVSGPGDYMR